MYKLPNPSRRSFTTGLVSAALAGMATPSLAGYRRGGADPIDRIPRHYTLRKFTSFSREEVYRLDHAARFGRQITIGDFTPSETRKILREALADWPATRQKLLR